MSAWKKLRYRIEAACCHLAAWGVSRLSRERSVRFANGLGAFGYVLDWHGRSVGLSNLRCAFGEEISDVQRREILRASYRNFARTMVDLFWAPALAKPENHHWARIVDWEAIHEKATREKRGIVFVGVHAGNWEWGSLACGIKGINAIAVAEEFKNPLLTSVFTGLRQATSTVIIPQDNSMLRMLRAVKRGGTAAMLADLNVPPSQAATVVQAFGLEMCASVLHAVLVQRGNALLVAGENISFPDGSFECRAQIIDVPENSSLRDIAQLCWDHFEPMLRKHPERWLWPYKHFRYRPTDADREYPDYANESKAFNKLRKREIA